MSNPWLAQVPAVFRSLADDQVEPPTLRAGGTDLDDACGYWGALHYTLSCLLGWSDTGQGLLWWYGAGQPTADSPVLALVRRVWSLEAALDHYAAWAWKSADTCVLQPDEGADAAVAASLARTSQQPDALWWQVFLRQGAVHQHDPFYGGSDALHLSIHSGHDVESPSTDAQILLAPDRLRGVLVTGGLLHWLSDLEALATQLPPTGERSWRIDVFDRRIGYLGEYRRSRVTGRWFTGTHSIHMRGNRPS